MARRSPDSPPSPSAHPDFSEERLRLDAGAQRIAGVDEVGRGPLAGPVVAAAVVLDPDRVPEGLRDSKQLPQAERERLFGLILASGEVALGSASVAEIDRLNIRQATFLAMRRAIAGLGAAPCHCLVDGRDVPPGLRMPATALVKGDGRSVSIAAASIVAKVVRDRMMRRLAGLHPAYGFERHVGYGTPAHLSALGLYGPCPQHRRSFSPVRAAERDTGPAEDE